MTNILKFNSFTPDSPIILIGPQGTGKSTTAKALAKRLNIPLIQTDMCMIDEEYEDLCKDKPGVEVEIKRHPNMGTYYDSNDLYPFCVIKEILNKYSNQKVVLDVGGTHAFISDRLELEVSDLFKSYSNLIRFTVYDDSLDTYQFLKQRRKGRGESVQAQDETKFISTIEKLDDLYSDSKKVSVVKRNGVDKTTDEIVDDVIRLIEK